MDVFEHVLAQAMDRAACIVHDSWQIGLWSEATASEIRDAMAYARRELGEDLARSLPLIEEKALRHLKFSEMLPSDATMATLTARTADRPSAAQVSAQPDLHYCHYHHLTISLALLTRRTCRALSPRVIGHLC